MTTDHRGRTFEYSAENELMRVSDAGASEIASYVYNAEGRRRFVNRAGVISNYYFDGDQEILEMDNTAGGPSAHKTLRRYIRLPGAVDEVMLMIDYTRDAGCDDDDYGACEVWAHANRLGSAVATTDDSGAVEDEYRYSPYGESGSEGDSGFPFRFTGQKLDAATGLYFYKARYYDPETGRFLQTDPIGYQDQMNLYAYVANDPINFTDPTGEQRRRNARPGMRSVAQQIRYDAWVRLEERYTTATGHPVARPSTEGWTPRQREIDRFEETVVRVEGVRREVDRLERQARSYDKLAERHQRDADNMRENPTVRPGMEGRSQEEIKQQQETRTRKQERDAQMFRERAEESRNEAERLRREELY